jgi:hypothetical protein
MTTWKRERLTVRPIVQAVTHALYSALHLVYGMHVVLFGRPEGGKGGGTNIRFFE